MNAPLPTSVPAGMHPDEWAARQQLAACYRVFALLGWTEMIYNHITLRLPASVRAARSTSSSTPSACTTARSPPAIW